VSILLLGRVVVGDIAVTLADLGQRGILTVGPDGDDWLLTAAGTGTLAYERRLLAALGPSPVRLSALVPGFGAHMDKARTGIVRSVVREGWVRRLSHGRRTPEGEALRTEVQELRRSLRRAMPGHRRDILEGPLLPYALRLGLIQGDGVPLAAFAHACARTLITEPDWTPPASQRPPGGVPWPGGLDTPRGTDLWTDIGYAGHSSADGHHFGW